MMKASALAALRMGDRVEHTADRGKTELWTVYDYSHTHVFFQVHENGETRVIPNDEDHPRLRKV